MAAKRKNRSSSGRNKTKKSPKSTPKKSALVEPKSQDKDFYQTARFLVMLPSILAGFIGLIGVLMLASIPFTWHSSQSILNDSTPAVGTIEGYKLIQPAPFSKDQRVLRRLTSYSYEGQVRKAEDAVHGTYEAPSIDMNGPLDLLILENGDIALKKTIDGEIAFLPFMGFMGVVFLAPLFIVLRGRWKEKNPSKMWVTPYSYHIRH